MKESKRIKKNRGMTYVELIVVLSIFAVMSSIVLFNYGEFQAKVDIKNLASDIALKIVEAQKSALSGNSPNLFSGLMKPSYGVYFDTADPIHFIYFADKDNNGIYSSSSLDTILDTIIITKNNRISGLVGGGCTINNNKLSIIFKRPDSSAKFASDSGVLSCTSVQISIASPKSATATIKIYPSGRVQVN